MGEPCREIDAAYGMVMKMLYGLKEKAIALLWISYFSKT
jgi:hypothetical protein